MSTIDAPMVPIRLAKREPPARKAGLTHGVATRLPVTWIPPEIVNRANSRTMNGVYSSAVPAMDSRPNRPKQVVMEPVLGHERQGGDGQQHADEGCYRPETEDVSKLLIHRGSTVVAPGNPSAF
jgi:hypothetical protein